MYQGERLQLIMELLEKKQELAIDDLVRRFAVSKDTIRRDLIKLEEKGQLVRTMGGAILGKKRLPVLDYQRRLQTVSKEKKAIGKRASSLIEEGDRIILDASTTVAACAEQLTVKECTIITNSINQADLLASHRGIRLQLLGGEMEKEHRFLYGTSVIDRLSHLFVDKAFIGVVGISANGLTIAHEEDGMVKRQMIRQARQVIVLADHSKINRTDFFRFASLGDVDILITDRQPDSEFQKELEKHHIKLLIVEEENDESNRN